MYIMVVVYINVIPIMNKIAEVFSAPLILSPNFFPSKNIVIR